MVVILFGLWTIDDIVILVERLCLMWLSHCLNCGPLMTLSYWLKGGVLCGCHIVWVVEH